MMTKQKLENHISHLEEQHRVLDKEIIERDCHYDESIECTKLKKKKLYIKDQIKKYKKKIELL